MKTLTWLFRFAFTLGCLLGLGLLAGCAGRAVNLDAPPPVQYAAVPITNTWTVHPATVAPASPGAAEAVLPKAGVTLEWDPSPDSWVAGYAIHYGFASSNYVTRVDCGNVTSCRLTNLTCGTTHYFVATAYTADGQESLPSNEVAYTPPWPRPQPPLLYLGSTNGVAVEVFLSPDLVAWQPIEQWPPLQLTAQRAFFGLRVHPRSQ